MDSAFLGTIVAWPINFAPQGWMFCEGQTLPVNQFQALYSLLGNTYGGSGVTTFCLPDLRARTIVGCNYNDPSLPTFLIGREMGDYQVHSVLPAHTHTLPTSGMTVDFSDGDVYVSASEMTINSTGTYGVPLTSETSGGSGMPGTSDYYIGATKMPNGTSLNAFYQSGTTPTVTTKPTTISVSGKGTPSINSSLSGEVSVTVAPDTSVSVTGDKVGAIPVMQPGLALRYIICVEGGLYPPRP